MKYKDRIELYMNKMSIFREDYRDVITNLMTNSHYTITDVRIAVFIKCTNVMNTAHIGFFLIHKELLDLHDGKKI
jgi:hypothetical protein